MPKKKKFGGRDFVKGNPGGPGKPPMPADLRALKAEKTAEYLGKLYSYLDSDYDLSQMESYPKIDQLILKVIDKAIVDGDYRCLEFLLERTIGKVADRVELTGLDEKPIQLETHSKMTSLMQDPEAYSAMLKLDEKLNEKKQPGSDLKII